MESVIRKDRKTPYKSGNSIVVVLTRELEDIGISKNEDVDVTVTKNDGKASIVIEKAI